jgi:hypothetical protein
LKIFRVRAFLVQLAFSILTLLALCGVLWALTAHGAEIDVLPAATPFIPARNLALQSSSSPNEVIAYISAQAALKGVNVQEVLWIVGHESQDGRNLRGDDGQSRGPWMISAIWHPEVSDACADSLPCSTEWSLNRILAGHINEWSTYKFCRKWYPDCPF